MLRASTEVSGAEFDINAVTGAATDDGGIEGGVLLHGFAEAVTRGDEARTATLRDALADALGEAAMIDAAAVAAAFHGFVRVVDATGAPVEGAAGGQVTVAFRKALGINEFYGARNP